MPQNPWRCGVKLATDFYIAALLIILSGHYFESDLVRVAGFQHEAVRIRRRIGDLYNLCYSLGALSYFSFLQGSLDEATQLLDECLAVLAEVDHLPWFRFYRQAKRSVCLRPGRS